MSPVFDRIGINGYRVLGYDKEEKITIHAETWQGPQSCPYCGACRLHSKGRYRRRARHLDCFGTSSQLLIHTRRYRCVECGRSFVPSLPGLLPWRQSTEPWRENVYGSVAARNIRLEAKSTVTLEACSCEILRAISPSSVN
jgi:transposase